MSEIQKFQDGTLKTDLVTNELLPEFNKAIAAALAGEFDDDSLTSSPLSSSSQPSAQPKPLLQTKVDSLSPVLDFLEGKHCLTGVSSISALILKINCSHVKKKLLIVHRAPVGGNMNSVMVGMCVNFMWIKMAKHL